MTSSARITVRRKTSRVLATWRRRRHLTTLFDDDNADDHFDIGLFVCISRNRCLASMK